MGNEKLAESHVNGITEKVEKLVGTILHEEGTSVSISAKEDSGKLFEGLRTKRGRMPYFEKNLSLVPSTGIKLPMNYQHDFQRHCQGRDQFFEHLSYQYVPLFKQLQQLLNVVGVYREIFEKHEENRRGFFSGLKDG